MKKITSILLLTVLMINLMGSFVFALNDESIKTTDIKKTMETYYATNLLSKEAVEEYTKLLNNKNIKPWEFKREREKFFNKHNIEVKETFEDTRYLNKSSSRYYEGETRVKMRSYTSFSDPWNNQKNYSTAQSLFLNAFLVTVGLAGNAGAIFSAVGSISSSFLENNAEHFTDIYMVANNSHLYDEKNIEVYSQTPYGYEWVPYVIAESRRTDTHVMEEWYYKRRAKNASDVFEGVRMEYADSYGDNNFLESLARGKYLSGNHNVETFRYYTGDSYDMPQNIPGGKYNF